MFEEEAIATLEQAACVQELAAGELLRAGGTPAEQDGNARRSVRAAAKAAALRAVADRLRGERGKREEARAENAEGAERRISMGGGWISVRDRLPENVGYSRDYLVRLENGDMLVAAWMNIGGWDFDPASPITHWMTLPEQPT